MATKGTISKDLKESVKTREKKEAIETPVVSERYFSGVGRRKTAVARVRIFEESTEDNRNVTVNSRELKEYFPTQSMQNLVLGPIRSVGLEDRYRISILVRGGGLSGQAAASSLGLARALVVFDSSHRPLLKSGKFLSRDSRKVERKKPGLKKARRAPQWSKR